MHQCHTIDITNHLSLASMSKDSASGGDARLLYSITAMQGWRLGERFSQIIADRNISHYVQSLTPFQYLGNLTAY